jgi:uncharacterized protein (TIGR00730 family)
MADSPAAPAAAAAAELRPSLSVFNSSFCASADGPPPLRTLRRVAVFCGSSSGATPEFVEAATALGEEMVKRNISLVYGGGNVGLMGAVATAVARGLGPAAVIGVIPDWLAPAEISGAGVGEVRLVKDMHSRKAAIFAEADAFISLPGGFGTLDETLEIMTWSQLGLHAKPVGILNVGGFFDHLLKFFDHATESGFVRAASRRIAVDARTPGPLLDALEAYAAPPAVVALPRAVAAMAAAHSDQIANQLG